MLGLWCQCLNVRTYSGEHDSCERNMTSSFPSCEGADVIVRETHTGSWSQETHFVTFVLSLRKLCRQITLQCSHWVRLQTIRFCCFRNSINSREELLSDSIIAGKTASRVSWHLSSTLIHSYLLKVPDAWFCQKSCRYDCYFSHVVCDGRSTDSCPTQSCST
jgi:hypothetical protein